LRTRIKICGITRPEDGEVCARLGADAIGLVFHRRSRRCVSPEQAREVAAALPPFITVVALFLDEDAATVERVLEQVPVDLIQFHGREDPAFCGRFGLRYLKVLPMTGDVDPAGYVERFPQAAGFLLDSHALGALGGTGETFDWHRYPRHLKAPLVLAGGLTPGNAAEAVRLTRPWGVDVSSGVESAPGIKDPRLVKTFIEEVQRVQPD
jgi:phosphoribosylanthranilate isomerase